MHSEVELLADKARDIIEVYTYIETAPFEEAGTMCLVGLYEMVIYDCLDLLRELDAYIDATDDFSCVAVNLAVIDVLIMSQKRRRGYLELESHGK